VLERVVSELEQVEEQDEEQVEDDAQELVLLGDILDVMLEVLRILVLVEDDAQELALLGDILDVTLEVLRIVVLVLILDGLPDVGFQVGIPELDGESL